jgi:hypothetical protein
LHVTTRSFLLFFQASGIKEGFFEVEGGKMRIKDVIESCGYRVRNGLSPINTVALLIKRHYRWCKRQGEWRT